MITNLKIPNAAGIAVRRGRSEILETQLSVD